MASIGVVGMGWVGSSVAMATLQRGVGKELLLNDVRPGIAEGEAMDLEHGSMFYRADATVRSVDLDEIVEQTDAVVLCAGRGGASGESRLSLLRDNHALATELGTALRAYRGVVVVVTNPVDVLTQVLADASGLPPARVIGTGTMLDTARLRYELAERLRIHPRSVHADVVGEHGDSSVCLWSSASIGGRGLRAAGAAGTTTARRRRRCRTTDAQSCCPRPAAPGAAPPRWARRPAASHAGSTKVFRRSGACAPAAGPRVKAGSV